MAENSKIQRSHYLREGNPNWKGGKTISSHGYPPPHCDADKQENSNG